MSEDLSANPKISPDGKWLAVVTYVNGGEHATLGFRIQPLEGGKVKSIPLPPNAPPRSKYSWSPNSKALDYVATTKGVSNIWELPMDGGKPRQVTYFKSQQIYNFDWSSRGDLAVSRGTKSSDAVMIRNFH